jgi:hypothetical protein
MVANCNKLTSPGCYRATQIVIHGELFNIDCYGLMLGSYDMVLGVQWMESLGLILWDFRQGALTFICNGHRVLWTAAPSGSTSPSHVTLLSAKGELMELL